MTHLEGGGVGDKINIRLETWDDSYLNENSFTSLSHGITNCNQG